MKPTTFFDDAATGQSVVTVAPLTDRINSEPPIMRGLSATETMIATAVFFPVWIFLGAFTAFMFSYWQLLVILSVIGPVVSVWTSAGFLARLKRDRPDHYYRHAFSWWRHRLGLGKTTFISHAGAWSLGRSMPALKQTQQGVLSRMLHAIGL